MIHSVIKKNINNNLFKVISKCADENGIECYLIGGYVRDLIIGSKKPKDVDIMVIGDGIEIAKKVCKNLNPKTKIKIYKNFGTAAFKYKNFDIEFVGARKESYKNSSRNPTVKIGTLNDDLNRRDFTINSIAIGLNSSNWGKILDKFKGLNDIENKLIKTPLDPVKTFSDDPLRMLRGIRFSCQLEFNLHPDLLNSISLEKNRINIISGERISEELNKILLTDKPSIGFKILDETGLLKIILPELTALKGIDEIEGYKHKDNFFHTLEVLDNICLTTNNLWLRWSAILHDIGKAPTKKFDKKIGWTFHGHEYVGSKMVKNIFKRLNLPLNETLKYVQKIVMMSSRPIVIAEDIATDSAVRRLIYDAGNSIEDLLTLCEADITTKNIKKSVKYQNNFKIVRKKITDLEEKDSIRNFQPPITGEIIMEHYKIKPCKEIGIIKEKIKNAILDGEIQNEYDQAFKLMIKIGDSIGLKNG